MSEISAIPWETKKSGFPLRELQDPKFQISNFNWFLFYNVRNFRNISTGKRGKALGSPTKPSKLNKVVRK